jgi:hypothetical protein
MSVEPLRSAPEASGPDQRAAARAAKATRASILPKANWPSERRTSKAAPGLPAGINIATILDCILLTSGSKLDDLYQAIPVPGMRTPSDQ